MRQQQISDVIQHHLEKWNRQYAIKNRQADVGAHVRAAIERANDNLAKISFEGVQLSKEELEQMKIKIPDTLKGKPVLMESVAHFNWPDGDFMKETKFGIEVVI